MLVLVCVCVCVITESELLVDNNDRVVLDLVSDSYDSGKSGVPLRRSVENEVLCLVK